MPEAQLLRYFDQFSVECGITGEAEDVADTVVVTPVHRLGSTVMAVATPEDVCARPGRLDTFGEVLDDGAHFKPVRRLRRPQDSRDGEPRARVIDVHRREAAFVVDARSRTPTAAHRGRR